MDLRQLDALVAVADNGSFSAAARALHTVQSNISAHIARLEAELGATMIDRSTGQVTEEGAVALARARRIQVELAAIVDDVGSMHHEVSGHVRLGVIGTTARWLVPVMMEHLLSIHPMVDVVVVDATTSSLIPQLVEGRLDIAVVNLPIDETSIVSEPLFEEDTILVVPAGHPLADRERIDFVELDGEPLLLEPVGTTFRSVLDREAADAGIEMHAKAEVDGMRLLASLAFQGFGAALVPASAAPFWVSGDWVRVPVEGLGGRTVGLARRRKGMLSAPSRAVRDVLHEVIESDGTSQPGVHPAAVELQPEM